MTTLPPESSESIRPPYVICSCPPGLTFRFGFPFLHVSETIQHDHAKGILEVKKKQKRLNTNITFSYGAGALFPDEEWTRRVCQVVSDAWLSQSSGSRGRCLSSLSELLHPKRQLAWSAAVTDFCARSGWSVQTVAELGSTKHAQFRLSCGGQGYFGGSLGEILGV